MKRPNIQITIILIFSCIIFQNNAILDVLEPQELIEQLNGETIPYELSKFGDIPYGSKMPGILVQANPIDGCTHKQQYHTPGQPKPIVLIQDSSKCSVFQKIVGAQRAGAGMVIVYSTKSDKPQAMKSDNGYAIEIPSIIIGKKQGGILKSFLDKKQEVQLMMNFNYGSENVFYLFLDPRHIFESAEFVSHFKEAVEWIPEHYIRPFYYIEQDEFQQYNDYCIGEGKYCADTKEQLQEVLYQHCLFKISQDLYFKYNQLINLYYKTYQQVNAKHNSEWYQMDEEERQEKMRNDIYKNKKNLHHLLVDQKQDDDFFQKLLTCEIDSFEKDQFGNLDGQNNDLFDESLETIARFNIKHFPSAVINDQLITQQNYYKQTNRPTDFASFVLYELCKHSNRRSKECSQYIFNYNQEYHVKSSSEEELLYDTSSGITFWEILMVCGGVLVLLFIPVFIWYRKRMNKIRTLQYDMIDSLVEDYYKLQNKNKDSNGNINEEQSLEIKQKLSEGLKN